MVKCEPSPIAWKQLNNIFIHIKLEFMAIFTFAMVVRQRHWLL